MSYKLIKRGVGKRGLGAIIEHKFLWWSARYTLVNHHNFKSDETMDIWVNQSNGNYHFATSWDGGRFYRANTEIAE